MTNMTETFYTATMNPRNWQDGEICMGEVCSEVYAFWVETQGMDPADFEHAFVLLEEEYFEFAYEDDKILAPRAWERLTSQ